jgi:prepilin-type N-terminal cleavage/methylation domain-containing protein
MKKHTNNKSGFTLVELAIVLVIIGLIVGGVLVGADLIKAATTQKAIKQFSDIDTGVKEVRLKYNALPGDVRDATTVLGRTYAGQNNNVRALGDGNGQIEASIDGSGTIVATLGASGEVAVFFNQLNAAGYVKETPTNLAMNSYALTPSASLMFAASALGKNALLVPFSGGAFHHIILTTPSGAAAAGAYAGQVSITTQEALFMDGKLDDGLPMTGSVVSVPVAAPNATATAVANCNTTTAYITGATNTALACTIAVRSSF